jgi:hypothetical protein
MSTHDILNAIDAEIAHLQQVRNALSGPSSPKRRGRPPAPAPTAKRRTLSPAARKKIADAQRKRWATQKAAAKKTAKKKSVKKVTVTKIPPKQQRERKQRVPKKAAVKHALSSKAETVAAPKNTGQTA